MEGFTVSLALVDAIPVLFFGASMILVAERFGSPLFIAGASLSTAAGCFKVLWKMILGVSRKDVKWLNKSFVPLQAGGFMLIAVSFVFGLKSINWGNVLTSVMSIQNRFRSDDAGSNWTAQIINCAAQASLFFAILLAG